MMVKLLVVTYGKRMEYHWAWELIAREMWISKLREEETLLAGAEKTR